MRRRQRKMSAGNKGVMSKCYISFISKILGYSLKKFRKKAYLLPAAAASWWLQIFLLISISFSRIHHSLHHSTSKNVRRFISSLIIAQVSSSVLLLFHLHFPPPRHARRARLPSQVRLWFLSDSCLPPSRHRARPIGPQIWRRFVWELWYLRCYCRSHNWGCRSTSWIWVWICLWLRCVFCSFGEVWC